MAPVPLHVVDHPIAQDILLSLRDKATAPDAFRQMARRISLILTLEATRDLPQRDDVTEVIIDQAVVEGRSKPQLKKPGQAKTDKNAA